MNDIKEPYDYYISLGSGEFRRMRRCNFCYRVVFGSFDNFNRFIVSGGGFWDCDREYPHDAKCPQRLLETQMAPAS